MATIKGFQPNEVKPQPGFEPSQNENGGWEGTHRFVLTRASFNNTAVRQRFRKGVSVVTLDQDVPSFFSFMKLARTKVSFDVGELVTIDAVFAGGEGAQYGGGDDGLSGSAQPTYELDGELTDVPLSEHPKFKELSDEQQEALGQIIRGNMYYDSETGKIGFLDTGDGAFDAFLPYDEIVTGNCLEFAKRLSKGITSYRVPTITWTERTEGNAGLTNSQLNALGNISTPRGSPPAPSGGRDWMLTSAHQSEVGGKYLTIIQWTLSERGGFDDFLYDD